MNVEGCAEKQPCGRRGLGAHGLAPVKVKRLSSLDNKEIGRGRKTSPRMGDSAEGNLGDKEQGFHGTADLGHSQRSANVCDT